MNTKHISRMLQLPELKVESLDISEQEKKVTIKGTLYIKKALCSNCKQISNGINKTVLRTVRDLPVWGLKCYLEFPVHELRCSQCDITFMQPVDFLSPYSDYTKRYEEHVVNLCKSQSISRVSELEGLGYKAVEGIFYRTLGKKTLNNRL